MVGAGHSVRPSIGASAEGGLAPVQEAMGELQILSPTPTRGGPWPLPHRSPSSATPRATSAPKNSVTTPCDTPPERMSCVDRRGRVL